MIEETRHFFSDGLYAKEMFLPKGSTVASHKHNYSHLSILAKGEVIVSCNDVKTTYKAPSCINIEADIRHEIEVLEDTVWFCLHRVRDEDVTNIDQELIKDESCL